MGQNFLAQVAFSILETTQKNYFWKSPLCHCSSLAAQPSSLLGPELACAPTGLGGTAPPALSLWYVSPICHHGQLRVFHLFAPTVIVCFCIFSRPLFDVLSIAANVCIDQKNQLKKIDLMQKVFENSRQSFKKSDNFWGKYPSRTMSTIYLSPTQAVQGDNPIVKK